jgi:signal transduction histidine kinase
LPPVINIHTPSAARSLRHTVLSALAIGFLLLTGAQYYVTGNFVERQLLEIESDDAHDRLGNLHHALEVMKEDLDSTTADWARWDSSYEFTTHVNTSFAADNLDPATIQRLRLGFVVMIDAQGRAIFAQSVAADGGSLVDAPAEIVRLAEGTGGLGGGARPLDKLTGFVATAGGVYLVSSQAVQKSIDNAPPRGRLIMGRSLPGFVVPALRRMTGEALQLQPLDAASSGAQSSSHQKDRDTLSLRDNQLSGYTPLDDLWGKPIAQLHLQMDRPTQALLAGARRHLLVAMLVVGLMFCVIGLSVIQWRVVAPLERLAASVESVGADGKTAARLPVEHGAREFQTLRAAINAMLQQLEQQQAIRRDRDAAVEANRLKSEFLATMSHEIRTPMNGVLGMCELLQRTDLDGRQKHLSDTILRSARSLLEILNDILDFSKIESGKLELEHAAFSPAEVVHGVSAPFIAAAQAKGIDFSVRIEAGVPPLLVGDALRLRQILNNLLSNAIKFTSQGAVTVSCGLLDVQQDRAELRFVVSDTGIGIAESVQEHVFEPFAQAQSDTTRRYGGTGLGLAIVRRLVTAMGGRIEIHSELGRGSTFIFTTTLYRAPDQLLLPRPSSMEATGPRFSIAHAPSVLLAEDNAVNREVLTEMLEHIGCRVISVENGALALAAVAGRTFDAILMDCQMPVMDGHTATAELRALEQATSQNPAFIIALTADATEENRKRCLDAGMNAVVTKPISQANLRDLILQAVRPANPSMM